MIEETIEQPFALESEQVVVSSCLLPDGSETYDLVSQIVSPDDFWDAKCKLIYTCICELAKDSKDIDEITVYDKIREKGLEDQIDGINGLYSISNVVETSMMALSASKIVQDGQT